MFKINTPEFVALQSLIQNKKMWDQICIIWLLLGQNLKNIIVILEICTFKLVIVPSFMQNFKFVTKNIFF